MTGEIKDMILTIATIGLFLVTLNVFGQNSGINTTDPKATLNIEPSNKITPTGEDGVLIPTVNNLPLEGIVTGQLIFLKDNAVLEDQFYYWDGVEWLPFVSNTEMGLNENAYVATGVGYTGTGLSRTLNFSELEAFDPTGFSVTGNAFTVGRTGKYLLIFNNNVKRSGGTTPISQANFLYSILKNGVTISSPDMTVTSSVPNELPSATSSALSGIVDLNQGDVLTATILKSNESPNSYQAYGVNSITLLFLHD
ncbi:hypothetical protein OOZ15_00265 [Galbibacter sp. EGI 63066]|uniref:hypothetical protein n=1 Tax=Galbibacter sp. EGI 63066 TaxID=2993559 RepID=UPI0022487C2C|nr:hypothetical protein [Galbibacter sp. EGI 63066]MCX2678362.1 hypothetical protein [Galbibacter sp. EGI 63066]